MALSFERLGLVALTAACFWFIGWSPEYGDFQNAALFIGIGSAAVACDV